MKKLIFVFIAAAFMACGGVDNKSPSESKIGLSEAGAIFPQPFYNIVFKAYSEKTGNDYQFARGECRIQKISPKNLPE